MNNIAPPVRPRPVPNISSNNNTKSIEMSKAKRFINRLRTEILPPRHASAVVALSPNIEVRN